MGKDKNLREFWAGFRGSAAGALENRRQERATRNLWRWACLDPAMGGDPTGARMSSAAPVRYLVVRKVVMAKPIPAHA